MTIHGHHGLLFGGGSHGTWTPSSLSLPNWYVSDNGSNVIASNLVGTLANKGSGSAGSSTGFNRARNNIATLNSRTVLSCDTSQRGYYTNSADTTQWKNKPFLYLFAVSAMRVAEVSPSTKSLLTIPRPTTNGVMAEIANNASTVNSIRSGGRRLTGDAFTSVTDATNNSTAWHITVAEFDFANGVINLYKDGTLAATGGSLTTGNTANTDSLSGPTIGLVVGGTNAHENYHLAECGFGNAILSAGDRQRLEGYLAHEWGMTANLPGGHPYKVFRP